MSPCAQARRIAIELLSTSRLARGGMLPSAKIGITSASAIDIRGLVVHRLKPKFNFPTLSQSPALVRKLVQSFV